MQAIAAIGARISEIEERIAQFHQPVGMASAIAGTSADAAAAASDPRAQAAFQARLSAAQSQLDSLTGASTPSFATHGLGALADGTGFPGMNGMGGAAGAFPVDPLVMAQRLGLDRAALAQSSIPSVAALAATSPAGPAVSAASATVSGVRNAKGIPVELAAFGNGKIPPAALTQLEGSPGHRLWEPAAASFDAMRRAAAADGVSFGITDSYRPLSVQQELVRTKGLYKNGGLAAVPGTSQHGWGMAVDLKLDGEAQAWMRTNAGRFGFVEDTPREPWHWTFKG